MQDRNAHVSDDSLSTINVSGRSFVFRKRGLAKLSVLLVAAAVFTVPANAQQCIAPPNTTVVAWFPFDETSGTTTANLATQNSGVLGGTATFIPGLVGGALHFDGAGAYVDTPSSIATNFGPGVVTGIPCSGLYSSCNGDFTIDLWIRVPVNLSDSVKTIVDKRVDSPVFRGYSFALSYSRLILQLADGGAGDGYTNYASIPITNLKDYNWHHIAVSVTRTMPNGIRWYHNGEALLGQQIDPTDREGSLANDSVLRIGANTVDEPFDNHFNGDMDELQIFNRALSGQEIRGLYNAGASGQCKQ
jgi:Concanavalin A-like lectin/glucanases superfamily